MRAGSPHGSLALALLLLAGFCVHSVHGDVLEATLADLRMDAPELRQRLTENGVTNLEDLLNLSAGDMKALRLNLGQRNRLTKWLARQQSEASDASAAPAAPGGQCTAAGTQCASFVSSGNCKLATKEPQRAKDLNAIYELGCADACRYWWSKRAGLKLTRTVTIQHRALCVFDDMVPAKKQRAWAKYVMKKAVFDAREGNMRDGKHASTHFSAEHLKSVMTGKLYGDVFTKMLLALRVCAINATGVPLVGYRAYTNKVDADSVSIAHVDGGLEQGTQYTMMHYANTRWERDWAGETLFYERLDDKEIDMKAMSKYNEQMEPLVAVRPRPGRVVIFDSLIHHTGRSANKFAKQKRLTTTVKTQPASVCDMQMAHVKKNNIDTVATHGYTYDCLAMPLLAP